jgi:hypothetical protein
MIDNPTSLLVDVSGSLMAVTSSVKITGQTGLIVAGVGSDGNIRFVDVDTNRALKVTGSISTNSGPVSVYTPSPQAVSGSVNVYTSGLQGISGTVAISSVVQVSNLNPVGVTGSISVYTQGAQLISGTVTANVGSVNVYTSGFQGVTGSVAIYTQGAQLISGSVTVSSISSVNNYTSGPQAVTGSVSVFTQGAQLVSGTVAVTSANVYTSGLQGVSGTITSFNPAPVGVTGSVNVYTSGLQGISGSVTVSSIPSVNNYTSGPQAVTGSVSVYTQGAQLVSGTVSISSANVYTSGLQGISGTVTAAVTGTINLDRGNNSSAPLFITGSITTSPVAVQTITGSVALIATGSVYTQQLQKTYYSSLANVTRSAVTVTDIALIAGSSTKTIFVTNIKFWSVSTTNNNHLTVSLIRRSTDNTGGTRAAITDSEWDSTQAAASAVSYQYTANPASLGTTVATVSSGRTHAINTGAAVSETPVIWDFTNNGGFVLRGTNEVLAVNLGGATTPTNFQVWIEFNWYEV